MNRKLGMISSAVTLLAVAGFALCMAIGSDYGSYLASMFIAWGFVPMICSFAAFSPKEKAAAGYSAAAFSAVYAVFVMTVYFAQLTAVRFGGLGEGARMILDYGMFGLFFGYDLLGYAFMALSTFLISFAVKPGGKGDRALVLLLRLHGAFAVSCTAIPMLGLFTPGMPGGGLIGVVVLEFWCAYFAPVCVLSYLHFRNKRK